MKSISTQVEMDEHMILRRLNMEIQGYPESYITDVNDMVIGADSSNMKHQQTNIHANHHNAYEGVGNLIKSPHNSTPPSQGKQCPNQHHPFHY